MCNRLAYSDHCDMCTQYPNCAGYTPTSSNNQYTSDLSFEDELIDHIENEQLQLKDKLPF